MGTEIKYFCDRCKKEVMAYGNLNRVFIRVSIKDEEDEYELCNICYDKCNNMVYKFFEGDE